jgi:hypothetical protein
MLFRHRGLLGCDATGLVGGYRHFTGALVTTYKTTRHNPEEDHDGHLHCHENLQSQMLMEF